MYIFFGSVRSSFSVERYYSWRMRIFIKSVWTLVRFSFKSGKQIRIESHSLNSVRTCHSTKAGGFSHFSKRHLKFSTYLSTIPSFIFPIDCIISLSCKYIISLKFFLMFCLHDQAIY